MKLEVRRLTFRDELKGFPLRIAWTLVLALFIALKLAHVTDWSLWWVLAPIWIPALLALVIIALGAAVFMLVRWFLMARAWLRLRRAITPELALADPAIVSKIEAERPTNTDDGGRDAQRAELRAL